MPATARDWLYEIGLETFSEFIIIWSVVFCVLGFTIPLDTMSEEKQGIRKIACG